MNEFQALSAEELHEMRRQSAQYLGDPLLIAAMEMLLAHASSGSTSASAQLSALIETLDIDHPHANVLKELAQEEVRRCDQIARHGTSALRGWSLQGEPDIEERKP